MHDLLERVKLETRELETALGEGALERAGSALGRRAGWIEKLALELRDSIRPEAVRTVLEQVLVSDAHARERLRSELGSARAELDRIRDARRATTRLSAGRTPARFVCERT